MDNDRRIADLIGQIYDAGLGVEVWDFALDAITRAIGAEVSTLFVQDRSGSATGMDVLALRGYPHHVPNTYAAYFAERDVRAPAFFRLPVGEIYADDRAMPFAEIQNSEIYNDFYRPIGVARGIGFLPFKEGRRFGILSAHRAIQAGDFRPEEIALLERLSPHVQRALQLHGQIARAKAVAGGLSVALNHFQIAVLLVDEQVQVIELNLAAEALIRRPESPLRLASGRFSAASSSDTAALDCAVAAAIDTLGDQPSAPPPILRLAKTDGSGAIGVMVVPARQVEGFGIAMNWLVLIFVSDPGQAQLLFPDLLTSQFGLSPTEAQVAARLAGGDRIEDIAESRRVSQETVRAQLKQVLAKTDTHSQGQLISLLSRSLAALRRRS